MSETEEILKKTIQVAQKKGINEIIALMTKGKTYQIRFSNSAIDNSKIWHTELLEIFLAKGQKTTLIDVESPTLEKINTVIPQTIKFLDKMPNSFLYSGMETEPCTYQKIEGLYDQNIRDFSEKAPELVNAAIQSSLDAGAKKVAGVLYFGDSKKELMTSHGVDSSYKTSYYRLTIRSFVDGESSGQDIICGRNLTNVEKKITQTGAAAGKIAKMAVGGKQGQAGKYDLIMSPTVAANIFGEITNGANTLKMMIGMSPLKNNLIGKKIASEQLNIVDNAHLGEGLGSRPFDVEGTPTSKTPIITNGVLTGILHNTSTSKMNQAKNTGSSIFFDFGIGSKLLAPAPSNMVYKSGNYSFEEIITECRKPTIYITSNWYTRFTNMIEGSFSTIPRDGMFLVEDGQVSKPVRKMRLTDNLLEMCSRISAIGKDIKQIQWWEVQTPTFIPTIKVSDCTFTSATQ